MSDRELETVVSRMYGAGWPEPRLLCKSGSDRMAARENWQVIIESIASRYLCSTVLRVDTLISLGPLASADLAAALDLAGWEDSAASGEAA